MYQPGVKLLKRNTANQYVLSVGLKISKVVPFHKDYCMKEPLIVVNLKYHELLKYHQNVLFCFVHTCQIRSERFYADEIQRMTIFHFVLTDRGESVPKSHKRCKIRHAIVYMVLAKTSG